MSGAYPALTHVEVTWVEKKLENWIRFGHFAQEQIIDRSRRLVSFPPGSIFAFVRWASNDFGTVVSRIDIIRAVAPGEAHQALPFIRPGGELLLHLNGWPKVERVLQLIDAVESLGIDPADAAPEYWRHVNSRLTAGHEPRAYARAQHSAWLLRRRAQP